MATPQKLNYKINFGKMVNYAVHGPHIYIDKATKKEHAGAGLVDDFPLYARTDKVGYEGRSLEWLQAIEKNYNSPRNIRGLKITRLGVTVFYYKPYVSNGNNKFGARYTEYANIPESVVGMPRYSDDNKTGEGFRNIFYRILNASIASKIQTGSLGTRTWDANSNTTVSISLGSTLSDAFKNDWALNNIEFIMLDDTVLLDCKTQDELSRMWAFLYKFPLEQWFDYQKTLGSNSIGLSSPEHGNYLKELKGNPFIKPESKWRETGVMFPLPYCEVVHNPQNDLHGDTAQIILRAIGRILNGGKDVTITDNGVVSEFPRLKFICLVRDRKDSFTLPPAFIYSPSATELGAYSLLGPLCSPEALKGIKEMPGRFSGYLLSTGVDLAKAGFSTYTPWRFDQEFLVNSFEKLGNLYKYTTYNLYNFNILSADKPKSESFKDGSQGFKPKAKDPETGPEQAKQVQPQQSTPQPVQQSNATYPLEIELNKQFAAKPSIAATSLSMIQKVYGDEGLANELKNFTPEGRQKYLKLLKEYNELSRRHKKQSK